MDEGEESSRGTTLKAPKEGKGTALPWFAMGTLFGPLAIAFAVFEGQSRRFDADKQQHHLASMMIAHASATEAAAAPDSDAPEIPGAAMANILAHLAQYDARERLLRVKHALKLIRTVASQDLNQRCEALARSLTDA